MNSIVTDSEADTVQQGVLLGRLLQPGDFIALVGDLGAGKTQFAKGIALGVGVSSHIPITSPTYTLMNEYQGRVPLYHFDLYRLSTVDDIVELGFEEYFYNSGVSLVEWAERLGDNLPEELLTVELTVCGESCRCLPYITPRIGGLWV